MTEIRGDNWTEFSSAVAEAVQAGCEVTIATGPEAGAGFLAYVSPPAGTDGG